MTNKAYCEVPKNSDTEDELQSFQEYQKTAKDNLVKVVDIFKEQDDLAVFYTIAHILSWTFLSNMSIDPEEYFDKLKTETKATIRDAMQVLSTLSKGQMEDMLKDIKEELKGIEDKMTQRKN